MPSSPTNLAPRFFDYLNHQDDSYHAELFTCAGQLLDNKPDQPACATPAFRRNLTAPFVPALPAAAENEAATLLHTLDQFRRQRNPPPYRLLIYLNFPSAAFRSTERMDKVNNTVNKTFDYLREYEDLPAGMVIQQIETPVIGAIRKFVTDLAILFSASDESHSDTLILTHDADTLYLHPDYLRNMWNRYQKGLRPGHVLASRTRHGYSRELTPPLDLPNMDGVIAWYDLVGRLTGSVYELGIGMNATDYLEADGYDPALLGSEVIDLMLRINDLDPIESDFRHVVPGTDITSSPRRIMYKLHAGIPPSKFWQPGDMLEAEYRDFPLHQLSDISSTTRDTFIAQYIKQRYFYMLCNLQDKSIRWGQADPGNEARRTLEYALSIGHAALGTADLRPTLM